MRRRKPELVPLGVAGDAGATSHYEDPRYYTQTYRRRAEDVAFYVDRAQQSGGPVLEYGVGNGRIALQLARAGLDVTGVDLSAPMLADLKQRLAAEPAEVRERVTLREGDMRSVRLRRRFPLVICPFNVVLHLYSRTDVEEFLARVRGHLVPGGALVFDFLVPNGDDMSLDPSRRYKTPRFRHPTTGELTSYAERFDYDPLNQLMITWMEFEPLEGGKPHAHPLTHRYFFPQEMAALLHYNGFPRQRWFEDFSQRAPGPFADSLVVEARAAEKKRRKS